MPQMNQRLDIGALRRKLAGARGKTYWRSLEEAAGSEEFHEFVQAEFPSAWTEPPDRRRFLQLMAASLSMAGMTACSGLPTRTIVPYVTQPEEIVPGQPLFYATAMQIGTRVTGLLVESNMGRPTKVEGNPGHPASLGATDIFAQAAILTLWDPDRSGTVLRGGEPSDWGRFVEEAARIRGRMQKDRGAKFRLLTETVVSPTLAAQIRQLLRDYPAAKWHQYEPVNRDAARQGAIDAFGRDVNPIYRITDADVILSLDADFLNSFPGSLAYARQFSRRRRPEESNLNRLYVVESAPTVTGSCADHRLRARAQDIAGIAHAIAQHAGVNTGPASLPKGTAVWIEAVARDLVAHRGRVLVIAGDFQAPVVHHLAHTMNSALESAGRTVVYTEPIEAEAGHQTNSLKELVGEMRAGSVDDLLILGGNPLYTAPVDLDFAGALDRVRLRIHASMYEDETSDLCHWHLPLSHFLEAWSDTRTFDGTCSIVQPLISPLYPSRSEHEILAILAASPLDNGREIVQSYWRAQRPSGDFDRFWRRSLHDGVVEGTAYQPLSVNLSKTGEQSSGSQIPSSGDIEIVFRPDPTIFDGRFANNGWLQELPKPITTLTWDNTAQMSPATAERLGLSNGDVVDIASQGRTITAPVWIVPGHADGSVTVHLGYGRSRSGHVGENVGFDANRIRTSAAPWMAFGALRKTGRTYTLAYRQRHQNMEGRDLVRVADIGRYRKEPDFAKKIDPPPPPGLSIYPGYRYDGHKWGMSIDLSACVGCNACTIACQAENNIPVVGKDQVERGRIMHWIRVDTYFQGDLDHPAMYHQPVPCMHCEDAPCEEVCPVGATVHSEEGLNEMVYNRCVGTRYCSNNCPYKVRRFNFFQYSDYVTSSLKGGRNPEVTVRSRGVMEKCTYCIQRIQNAKIKESNENRPLRDGEILTACQQVCPAEAIIFGDLNDRNSRVSRLKSQQRDYGILVELNTRPRTTYLAKITNPNGEVKEP